MSAAAAPVDDATQVHAEQGASISYWGDAYRRLTKDRLAVVCFLVIVAYAVIAFASYFNLLGDPDASNPEAAKQAPTWEFIFGTNVHGQNVASRIAGGTWIACALGFTTAIIATLIGGVLGAIAGWFGKWVDEVIVWIYSTVATVPRILLIISITYVFKAQFGASAAFWAVLLAMGLANWVDVCRIIRAEFMKLKERDYVLAARALGFGNARIMFVHIIPYALHLLIIMFTLLFVEAIKAEVVISFLGVGLTDEPSWGLMIQDAEAELTKGQWWQMTFTSVALFGIVLAFQVFGDALRDALDPRLRH